MHPYEQAQQMAGHRFVRVSPAYPEDRDDAVETVLGASMLDGLPAVRYIIDYRTTPEQQGRGQTELNHYLSTRTPFTE